MWVQSPYSGSGGERPAPGPWAETRSPKSAQTHRDLVLGRGHIHTDHSLPTEETRLSATEAKVQETPLFLSTQPALRSAGPYWNLLGHLLEASP